MITDVSSLAGIPAKHEQNHGQCLIQVCFWPDEDVALTITKSNRFRIINHLARSTGGTYLASISRINDSAVRLLNLESDEAMSIGSPRYVAVPSHFLLPQC